MSLVAANGQQDILPEFRETAVEDLLLNHNMGTPHRYHDHPSLLVGTCTDFRERFRFPANFAYVIRTVGGNLRYSEFQLSYAIAVGGVTAIALIGHTQCAMVNLISRREQFVSGLVERAGWPREWAEAHFLHHFPMFEIGNEMDFLYGETLRLRIRYPKILIAPLLYRVEDNRLYQLAISSNMATTDRPPTVGNTKV